MKKPLLALLLFLSWAVQAHPGHDHDHWLSEPIHALVIISIFCVIAAMAFVVRHRQQGKKTSKRKKG